MRPSFVVLAPVLLALACGGSQPPPEPPAEEAAQPSEAETPTDPVTVPPDATGSREELSTEQCEASGGMVVGDIGDGAIHRPEYRCPNGAPPSGNIRPAEGGPIAIEGSVCCPG